MRSFYVCCHLFKVSMELILEFPVDGRKLCTGSRDNWMCLWDIESAKCEHRRNISRNLVSLSVCFFPQCVLDHEHLGFSLFLFFFVQVTHVCWVPGSSSVVQTSEDKMIRYTNIYSCLFDCSVATTLNSDNRLIIIIIPFYGTHFDCLTVV